MNDEEEDSPKGLENWANHVVDMLNLMAQDPGEFTCPENFVFADDLTQNPIKPVGKCVLDEDFPELMQIAFSGCRLQDLADNNDILAAMAGEDRLERASEIINTFVANESVGDPGVCVPPQDY